MRDWMMPKAAPRKPPTIEYRAIRRPSLIVFHRFPSVDPGGWSLSAFRGNLRLSRYTNPKYFTASNNWTLVFGMKVFHFGRKRV